VSVLIVADLRRARHAGLLTLWRIVFGPSILDRAVASDVLLTLVMCALGADMVINHHTGACRPARHRRRRRVRLDRDRALRREGTTPTDERDPRRRRPRPRADRRAAVPHGGDRPAALPRRADRLHAATKPQVLGFILICIAMALALRAWPVVAFLVPVVIIQLATAPLSAHMVGRQAYRNGTIDERSLYVDELAEARAPARRGRLSRGSTNVQRQCSAPQWMPGGCVRCGFVVGVASGASRGCGASAPNSCWRSCARRTSPTGRGRRDRAPSTRRRGRRPASGAPRVEAQHGPREQLPERRGARADVAADVVRVVGLELGGGARARRDDEVAEARRVLLDDARDRLGLIERRPGRHVRVRPERVPPGARLDRSARAARRAHRGCRVPPGEHGALGRGDLRARAAEVHQSRHPAAARRPGTGPDSANCTFAAPLP
jgi:monovalent cation/proton antiporter MnhG/PhaG subunit